MTLNVRVGTVVFLVLVLSTGTVRDMDSFRGREGKMAFFHFGKYWRKLPGDIFKFLIENINKTFLRFFHAVMTLNVGVGNVVFLVLVLSTVRDMDYFRGKEGKMVSCKGKEGKVE